MTESLQQRDITCPYCGEPLVIVLDLTAGDQQYIEDCQVCCRPMEIGLTVGPDGDIADLAIKREDE